MGSPVFLLASERSGTNLLRRRLTENQNQILGPAPLHLLKHMHWAEPYYGDFIEDNRFEEFVRDSLGLAYNHFSPWDEDISVAEVKSSFDNKKQRSSVQVMDVLYTLYAQRKGYATYFCKDNNLFDFVADILLELPDAKFVYLYRDPRDVVLSQLKRPLQVKNVYSLAKLWRDEQIKCLRYAGGALKSQDKILTVSYEDLIVDEENVLNKIFNFLKLSKINKSVKNNLNEKTDFKEWENLDKPTIKNNFSKYKDELTNKQISIIENVCWYQMRALGYKTEFESKPSISNEMLFIGEFLSKIIHGIKTKFRKPGLEVSAGQLRQQAYINGLRKKWL